MAHSLVVERVSVYVGSRLVVRDASLEASGGAVTVLMGPNGAGKSSLLAAIAGIPRYRLVGGRVLVDGVDFSGLKCWERAERGVVLSHQMPPASRFVKTMELVKWMCGKYGWSLAEAMSLAESIGVEHLLNRLLFKNFSGGEKKRLELYLTMLQRPRVALLDEPDSGVDVDSLRIIRDAIIRLTSMGTAVVLVSHTLQLLRMLGEKKMLGNAYVLVGGRIVGFGEAESIINRVEREGFNAFREGEQ